MPTADSPAVSAAEAKSLFSDLVDAPALILAVSGGPDSTALMLLAARWRDALRLKPKLTAVTVDHGLRAESKREAAEVGRLAGKLGLTHRVLNWTGRKPDTGLQEAARAARYALLAKAAREAGALHVLTAHTLDDQAETVLIRMTRGSGLAGLSAMSRIAPLPGEASLKLVRPLLEVPKARLIATLRTAQIGFADDPSNRDPRFTRARLRGLMPALAAEGLDAPRLALLARRLKRADAAIEAAVTRAMTELALTCPLPGATAFDARRLAELPAEVGLRLLGRAIGAAGDEGPVELAKLEALKSALNAVQSDKSDKSARFRRSLAGAIVTLAGGTLIVERAPRRRGRRLTTPGRGKPKAPKTR